MKTLIDIDEDVLDAAAKELGTTTKKDTVNAALAYVA
ncbi:MAG: type II toxin-antitoxin system VapB family antitoxin, partial [Mycobacterium sp.]